VKIKYFFIVLVVVLFSMSLLGFSTSKITYRVVFTSGMEDGVPIDNLDKISINSKKIMIFTYWYNLRPNKKYKYDLNVYDGESNLIDMTEMIFKPTDISWNTQTSYKISSRVDKPGDWKFEVLLDNRKVFEKYLKVEAEEMKTDQLTIHGSAGE
jgi:hypothetical protein